MLKITLKRFWLNAEDHRQTKWRHVIRIRWRISIRKWSRINSNKLGINRQSNIEAINRPMKILITCAWMKVWVWINSMNRHSRIFIMIIVVVTTCIKLPANTLAESIQIWRSWNPTWGSKNFTKRISNMSPILYSSICIWTKRWQMPIGAGLVLILGPKIGWERRRNTINNNPLLKVCGSWMLRSLLRTRKHSRNKVKSPRKQNQNLRFGNNMPWLSKREHNQKTNFLSKESTGPNSVLKHHRRSQEGSQKR